MATTFVYQSRSEDAWDARANQAPGIEDITVIQQGKQYVVGCWDEGLTLMTDKRFSSHGKGANANEHAGK